jgi:hypothetical protein
MSNILAMTAAIAATGPNMNTAVRGGGGGEYTPPAAGMTRLRLVAYVETGRHEKEIQGKKKVEEEVQLVFELSGPKHQPREHEGQRFPARITVRLNRSLNEKAGFYKLFKRMNYKGTATHMSQLLGEAFIGTVVHTTKGEGPEKVTYANLKDDAGFTIQPPRVPDPLTGDHIDVPVDPPISALRLFVWDASPEFVKPMWDSLFIDGEAGEGDKKRSLNVFQNQIKAALNYVGSPVHAMLASGGLEPDLPGTEQAPAAGPANDDPLNGMT